MRFRNLRLVAFGPFSGLTLDLSGGSKGGLHLIFGGNEAGKTSALRAVRDLLFGIPERTQDAHRHPMQDLCVSAVLENASGRTLEIVRRKRRKDALRNHADEPLDQASLREFVGELDAALFERVFGLDHQRLRQAGENLLQGGGDVAESLFDAGAGGRGIRSVLGQLERERDELFRPRAPKSKIPQLVEAYKKHKAALRDALHPPEKCLEQRMALEAERARQAALREERRQLREEEHRVRRTLSILPRVEQRRERASRKAELGAVPALPSQCRARRERCQAELLECQREIQRLEPELAQRRRRLCSLSVPEWIALVSEASVLGLRDGVGIYRKALRELPRLEAECQALEQEALRLLQRVLPGAELESVNSFLPTPSEQGRLRRLSEGLRLLRERRENTAGRLRETDHSLDLQHHKLSRLAEGGERDTLERAIAQARSKGDLDERLRELAAECALCAERATQKRAGLGLFAGDLEALLHLPVPPREILEHFEAEFQSLREQQNRLEEELRSALEQEAAASHEIARLERGEALPSEADLERARNQRDWLWAGLLQAFQTGELEGGELRWRALSAAFERALAQADAIADQLRREALRLSDIAARRIDLLRAQSEKEQAQQRVSELAQRRNATEGRWAELWRPSGIEPREPRQMRSWLLRQGELCELIQTLQLNQGRLNQGSSERRELCHRLCRALGKDPSPELELVPLLLEAEQRLSSATEALRERRSLEQQILELELCAERERKEVEAVDQALNAEQSAWKEATSRLGLEVQPDTVAALLDDLVRFERRLEELRERRRHRETEEAELRQFSERVRQLVGTHEKQLEPLAPDLAAEQFVNRFQHARHACEEREHLEQTVAELESKLEATEHCRRSAEQELDLLLQGAGVASLEALCELETRALEQQGLVSEIALLEKEIVEVGEGLSLHSLLDQALGSDRTKLTVRLAELEEELQSKDDEFSDTTRKIAGLERGLELYESAEAAERIQELEVQTSEIRATVERYARVHLAHLLVERTLEHYREQHQGPVLRRASELFSQLTLERYHALKVGVEERVLSCVRCDGAEVGVRELSEGTQYQLYLALRLASLEQYFVRNEAFPLVLDDILIHFDDKRATAALEVLAELGTRTQVLFFTHLGRDLEIAQRALLGEHCFYHLLAAPPTSSQVQHDLKPLEGRV